MEFKKIIRDAIRQEEDSYELYIHGASVAKTSGAKILFQKLAGEEMKHKQLLESVNPSLASDFPESTYHTLELENYLQLTPLNELNEVKEILKFAIKKETKAFKFYSGIANALHFGTMQGIFERLAAEEQKHKNMVQLEFGKLF